MTAKQMNAPQTRILSARGSSIRPNLLVMLSFRAMGPSIISVRPAIMKTVRGGVESEGSVFGLGDIEEKHNKKEYGQDKPAKGQYVRNLF